MTKKNNRGITLIELLVVVTIIGLFAALVVPRIIGRLGGAKQTAAKAQINDFTTALGTYKLDTGHYPTTEQGLQALRVKPQGVERWDGPYLTKDLPVDPWGNAYIYKYPGDHGDEPDIMSLGRDGKAGGDGEDADILSWKN
jgi:general secretion pathway protein G